MKNASGFLLDCCISLSYGSGIWIAGFRYQLLQLLISEVNKP